MIYSEQYFGGKPHTGEHELVAGHLLDQVNALINEAVSTGEFVRANDPDTGTEISGSKDGSGDGGFRLSTATTGRLGSPHKEAKGVDVYDPYDHLDDWLTRFDGKDGSNTKLEEYGLYREHPVATPGWCHLQIRPVQSGRRTYYP